MGYNRLCGQKGRNPTKTRPNDPITPTNPEQREENTRHHPKNTPEITRKIIRQTTESHPPPHTRRTPPQSHYYSSAQTKKNIRPQNPDHLNLIHAQKIHKPKKENISNRKNTTGQSGRIPSQLRTTTGELPDAPDNVIVCYREPRTTRPRPESTATSQKNHSTFLPRNRTHISRGKKRRATPSP